MANSTTLYTGQDGRIWVDVTENKVLTNAQCGVVQNVQTDGITLTLPASAAGESYTVRNGGDAPSGAAAGAVSDESMEVTVSPNSSDTINGLQITPASNKDLINTQATAHVGDEATFIMGGSNAIHLFGVKGTWAREG